MPLPKAVREILCHYPLAGMQITPVEGGFSGTSLWRVTALGKTYGLRAWPRATMSAANLAVIHRLMTAAKDLPFVPTPVQGRHYQTVFPREDRVWDLTAWMPGRADFSKNPSVSRIEAACFALAQLHSKWFIDQTGPCPAVRRRLESWQTWTQLVESGWKPAFALGDPFQPWAEPAWKQLETRMSTIPGRLDGWQSTSVPLQPCLCDVWHDHVLFTGDDVTGLIDFGGVKIDNVAVDLARMLGSMGEENKALWSAGLAAYEQYRPLRAEERELIPLLDQTGTILGAANWLRWVYHERRQYKDPAAAAQRLATLVQRMESWP